MSIRKLVRIVAMSLIGCLLLAGLAVAAGPTVAFRALGRKFNHNGATARAGFIISGAPHELVTVEAVALDAAWITIDPVSLSQTFTLNARGKRIGSVKYHVARYEASAPNPRLGTIGVGSATFAVSQAATPCTVAIKPPKTRFGRDGGSGSIEVTAPEGCNWTAAAEPAGTWLAFAGEAVGSGPGTVTYTVAGNDSGRNRIGKVRLAPVNGKGVKKTHTVTQSANLIHPASSAFVVFAWNDLGMHCLNPTYDDAVILPPYNTLWAQVVRRGNPPAIVTSGIQLNYRIINNTFSYGKHSFGQFWDNMQALFGTTLPHDRGLNLEDPLVSNGLGGLMLAKGDHFQANGIPLTPVEDGGVWNPFQVAEVTVRDANTGALLAQTRTTVPTSDEIRCDGCHGTDVAPILTEHDNLSGTTLQSQKPVLCAGCHASPALGSAGQAGRKYLSESIHTFHGNLAANQPTCYNCHPGENTRCNRSLRHTAPDGNCTTCHGSLTQMGSSITAGRVPWVSEPACAVCHSSNIPEVATGATLYRNAIGHGGMRCASCHGSPHAMVPSREAADNYQVLAYQGKAVTIGSCAACHDSSRGEDLNEFNSEHGGLNPHHRNACHICHTVVPLTPTLWPHAFKWVSR